MFVLSVLDVSPGSRFQKPAPIVSGIRVNRTVVSDLTAAGTKAPDDQAPEVT
jgi:hypothetical protein